MYDVTLTIEDVSTVKDGGSVVTITGTTESGDRITFAGDHREMVHILGALVTDAEDEVVVAVEGWQVLRVRADDDDDQAMAEGPREPDAFRIEPRRPRRVDLGRQS